MARFLLFLLIAFSFAFAQSELDISDFDFLDDDGEIQTPEEQVEEQVEESIDEPAENLPENEVTSEKEDKQEEPVEKKQETKTTQKQNKKVTKVQDTEDIESISSNLNDNRGFQSKQVQLNEERTTQYITLSGSIGTFFVSRGDFFSDAIHGIHSKHLDGDFFDPYVTLNFDIQLENNIKAILELRNESRTDSLVRTKSGDLYITNRSNQDNLEFQFEKAYIQVQDFITEGLQFKVGIIPHKYSLRPDGGSFFLNLGESESPFNTNNHTHAMGFLATYQPVKMVEFYIDAFYFKTMDSDFERNDETIFGLNFDFYMPQTVQGDNGKSITLDRFFNVIVAGIQDDNQMPLWTVGFGFDYFFGSHPDVHLWELYGEALLQWGEHNPNGKAPFSSEREQDHLAFGAYLGLKWSYEAVDTKPFIDVSFWYLSGDDDDEARRKNNDLVSYEDIDSTLIMEDNNYGLDVDSNYWAVKFKTGLRLTPITKEEVRLELLYAHFQAIDAIAGQSKNMGDEIDVRLTWEYSADLTFSLAAGFLMNANYFEDAFDELNGRGRNNTFIIRFESMLRF